MSEAGVGNVPETRAVHEGGCVCRRLRFRARGAPLRVGLCHCMTCRKTSGAVFHAFAIYPKDRVEIEGAFVSWAASESGDRCFCPTCHSHVFGREGDYELTLGAFDAPNVFEPTYEAWVIRRERWLRTHDLKAFERNREDG